MNLDSKLAKNLFKLDQEPHIVIDQQACAERCRRRECLVVCPANLFSRTPEGRMVVNWEGCLECGTCLLSCSTGALAWDYPRAGFGVHYRAS